ncbi:hypothetical protein NX059_009566 [Plenodomus lindquistii]|nr:hypothetical protein NX059_009566 [Plenodomus lindquistii]
MLFKYFSLAVLASTTAIAAPPKPHIPRRPSDAQIYKAIAGTYTLLNTSSTANFIPVPDRAYGTAPVGILIYTATGFMSATITATEPELRPNLTFPFNFNDTDADWALVGKHSIGYAGPLRINAALPANETSGQVFHGPLTVANVPTWQGDSQPRNYTVIDQEEEGEMVRYLRIGSDRGNGNRGVLWWKRID